MVFKQIEDSLISSEFNGIISLFRKHSPVNYSVQLQDNIVTPYGLIELHLEDTILLDTGILISEETILAEPSIKLKAPSFPHSNYTITLDVIHYTGANIFDDTPTNTYEVKDTITLNLPPNTVVPIPVENLQKGYIISLNAQLNITHDKTVITGRPPILILTSDKIILSAYDGDTATLTAYYSQDGIPIPDTTVTFYNGETSLGTGVTDENGEATLVYTSTGAGDMVITAEVGSLSSETYSIEDCKYYSTTEYKQNTDGITLDIALPSTFKLEYDIKPTSRSTSGYGSGCYLRLGADSNSGVWAGQLTSAGRHGLMPKPSGTTQYCTSNTVLDTDNHIVITFDGSTVSYTCNNESVSLSASSFGKINGVVPTANNGLKNIKIKPL